MTPGEIMNVLQKKNILLTEKNDEYLILSETRANAKRDYNVAFAKELLLSKADGVPVTIVKEISKGCKNVADLKFKFELALAIEKACLESMKDIREAIGAARSILTWMREEKVNP